MDKCHIIPPFWAPMTSGLCIMQHHCDREQQQKLTNRQRVILVNVVDNNKYLNHRILVIIILTLIYPIAICH